MLILIISAAYALAAGILLSCIIKSFLKMRSRAHDPQLHRQYFFTALIMFCILLISFIAILLKIRPSTALRGLGGVGISTVYDAGSGFDIVKYLVYLCVLIIALALLFFFDKYVLKRTAKNETEYRTRRKLAAGAVFIALLIGAAMQLIR